MVSIKEEDRDSLRFLWTANPCAEKPEPVAYRFTRVVFGVSSSPFLLNATINHHIESFRKLDPDFVEKFLSSIYVDDLVSGADDVDSAREFYLKSKMRLANAGFKLRKFVTSSQLLHDIIVNDDTPSERPHVEEDQSYAKASLGVQTESGNQETTKVLGVQWNIPLDQFEFDMGEVAQAMEELEPSKRNLVSVAARFFDPLGVVSPVSVLFKIFCQQLCVAKVGWDQPLTDQTLVRWKQLLAMLKGAKLITIPRCVYHSTSLGRSRLVGFCDASGKAYAAVVYLQIEDEGAAKVRFLASKTRVTPVSGMTIPRLELLSALLLAKLLTSIRDVLQMTTQLEDPVCFTDSMASMYWIKGVQHDWKQFVENRVTTIRGLVHQDYWQHCPGRENPADIPSRGLSASGLSESQLWLNGPKWLWRGSSDVQDEVSVFQEVPEDCKKEIKCTDPASSVVVVNASSVHAVISKVLSPERYSNSCHLLRVTSLVLRAVNRFRGGAIHTSIQPSAKEMEKAKLLWLRDMQAQLTDSSEFSALKTKLDLFLDKDELWRCGGRMLNTALPFSARNPILLARNHHLTTLLVFDAHERVLHNGVRETLAELRSAYWVVKGRQLVKRLLRACTTCRRHEGPPCQGVPSPPLPSFRVTESRPFQTTGVDYAGPLYIRTPVSSQTKVWMVLYTCYVTRAVHLDLVQDMTAETFLRSLRRFTARRGTPTRIVSDNAKTFKSSAASLAKSLGVGSLKWQFNLEKAPWQGGAFERMIKSAKRCLRKAIGRNSLTFDELQTLVTEVEGVLNSRPLTYVYDSDITEPLTPSHLLVGYRILTLPDPSSLEDPADDYSREKLTRRAAHLNQALNKFWRRWKREYLLELRELHRVREHRGTPYDLRPGEVVTVYDEGHPRGMWRLGRIETLVPASDGKVRGVSVRVMSKGGRAELVRRPIQLIYPLEIHSPPPDPGTVGTQSTTPKDELDPPEESSYPRRRTCSTRKAALNAKDRIEGLLMNETESID